MVTIRKSNFSLLLIFLCIIVAFALAYNSSVKAVVSNAVASDRELLKSSNSVIIEKLTSTKSTKEWKNIIVNSGDIAMTVFNSNNDVVVDNEKDYGTTFNVSELSAFEYGGEAYMLKSSVFLLREFTGDSTELLRFILTEFIIAASGIAVLAFFIYKLIVRPYREFYLSIEEYEKTGEFRKNKFGGYIGTVYERFGAMTKNLERQQKNQQRIIASISHDIKTPLTSIMGYAERLSKDNIPEERRKRYLSIVYDKSIEIRELVDEFDEYLSYNMNQSLKLESESIENLSEMLKSEYSDELDGLGIDFEIINNAADACIMIDNIKMRRVFGNIIGNSLKHFKDTEEKKITLSFEENKHSVHIFIDDNGEGVEKDKLDVIFEPLYTSDKGRKVAGLGLAICREIIESHGGKIFACLSPLGGLRISIELAKNE